MCARIYTRVNVYTLGLHVHMCTVYVYTYKYTYERTIDRCSLTTELRGVRERQRERVGDPMAPKVTFFYKCRRPAAARGRNNIKKRRRQRRRTTQRRVGYKAIHQAIR